MATGSLPGLVQAQGVSFSRCSGDSVLAGTVCTDTYEASVWRVPNAATTNRRLVQRIRNGTATLARLQAGGAAQLGAGDDNYGPCTDNGQSCMDIYAVSIAGVMPSRFITWFQAQQACANAFKRLPNNAEWQVAVAGTPDPVGVDGTPDTEVDDDMTDCNSTMQASPDPANTGARMDCVSRWGAFDMVGNLWEWVADWVPQPTLGEQWDEFSGDTMFLAMCPAAPEGAPLDIDEICPPLAPPEFAEPGPRALRRGGSFSNGAFAGPLAVDAASSPSFAGDSIGFRCVR